MTTNTLFMIVAIVLLSYSIFSFLWILAEYLICVCRDVKADKEIQKLTKSGVDVYI